MSFVRPEYLGLLLAVCAVYWRVSSLVGQNVVLLVASAVFYGWVHPVWVVLLYGSATVDFVTAQLMVRARAYRRLWLALSLASNLGLLFWFKYFDFFVENARAALGSVGVAVPVHALGLVLPAGISFYTFQTLSYTIDVYRGELRPRRSYLDYLVFVSLFPQLMAGPIERASRLLPQVERQRRFSLEAAWSGVGLGLWGAFKKVVIADTLAPYVDKVFLLKDPAGTLILAATVGFMVQIYADFSGYTDIARGSARLLGFELGQNFDEPYLARSTPEFWQRWHMSLSSWIRDYLLAPLLGSGDELRPARFAFAVTVTMVVMGLWHGAGWNFAAFGAFQAAAILFYTALRRWAPAGLAVPGPLAAAIHVACVGVPGALLFREPSVARIGRYLASLPAGATQDEARAVVAILALVAVANLPLVAEHVARRVVFPRLVGSVWRLPLQTTAYSVYIAAIAVFYRSSPYDFVYFQF